ncbi:glycoside hydrolase family 26 protein [Flavobacterium sp. 5]|uniref:glycoside hydrolase family 26 protein n=1 Tax=Flavobacterium sp. 5 TaxID=2035199 RepID=UPI000C2CD6A4|nr:glycosyl hydrolase [Flavobacterium sp. 5]PKB17286.1 mannan endo-1,4-beta-mannosidase [Flavobacterium sp. 5]
MTKTHYILPILLTFSNVYLCSAQKCNTKLSLCDKKSTAHTSILYENLRKKLTKEALFGHQDDLAYGVNWKYEQDRSDIKDVVGDYPAVYGWDMTGVEKDALNNIDGVPFDKEIQFIKDGYTRGGVITMSWHMDNPLTDKDAWDTTPKSLISALPGGKNHEKYKSYLDKGVVFFNSLKDKKGKVIPILFRPFHELNGTWFWWCKNNASPEEFKSLWRFTMDYLQEKGVHNLIYVYNTSDFKTKEEYLEYYPGDSYVDIVSFDKYQYTDSSQNDSFIKDYQNELKILNEVALEKNKLMAVAETGYEGIPDPKWWTEIFTKAIGDYKVSYVLLWRNHGWQEKEKKMHYYVPFKGQVSENDFVDFYNTHHFLFEKDAAKLNLYKK